MTEKRRALLSGVGIVTIIVLWSGWWYWLGYMDRCQHEKRLASPSPTAHVVWCESLWSGPATGNRVLIMVWSDGDVWTAPARSPDEWDRLTRVRTPD